MGSVCLSVCLSVCRSVCLSVCLSVKGLPQGTRLAVITRDEFSKNLGAAAAATLTAMGVDLSLKEYRSSMAFLAEKGYPKFTQQNANKRKMGPTPLNIEHY